jgi:hypothetical protein
MRRIAACAFVVVGLLALAGCGGSRAADSTLCTAAVTGANGGLSTQLVNQEEPSATPALQALVNKWEDDIMGGPSGAAASDVQAIASWCDANGYS